jgi:hypothetical protein
VRADKIILSISAVALVVAPVASFLTHGHPYYDALRWFVLVQCFTIMALYSFTLLWTARRIRHNHEDSATKAVIYGSMLRGIGIILLILRDVFLIQDRLGNPHLNWNTPMVQVILTFLLASWALIDRNVYASSRSANEIVSSVMDEDKT